jgi:hypothetical protein
VSNGFDREVDRASITAVPVIALGSAALTA